MPDLPISQLPPITALTPDSQFVVEQGGVTYRVPAGFASSGNLHGSFHSELTQSATTADTALIMSAETTDFSVGVTVVDNSKITVSSGGTFNFQFSSVFQKIQGGSIEFVSIWPRVNNIDVDWSNTDISMANNNELIVAAWNFVLELNAGDYVQLIWSSTSNQVIMQAIPPQLLPTRPGTPSVIITLTQI
jgi:hypothetical protein